MQKENATILLGDCLEVLKTLPDNSVDAIVTDPPYGISFMAKKWDYDVPKCEVWREVLRVLKPGGHALVACGTRTQHRMAVNLEDAGFEVRDIVAWVYGCLSDDTEILTKKGWVRYDISKKLSNFTEQKILIYDVRKGAFKWEVPQKWNEYAVERDTAYRIQSDYTDQIVSRGHRCLVERNGRLVFKSADTLKHKEVVPFLEGVPSVRNAVSSAYKRAGGSQQVLLSKVRGNANSAQEKNARGEVANGANLPYLRNDFLQADLPLEKIQEPLLLSRVQRKIKRLAKRLCGKRQGQAMPQQERKGRAQRLLEGRRNAFQAQRQICRPSDKIRSLSARVFEYGAQGRLCNGAPIEGSAGDWQGANSYGVRASYKPRRYRQSHRKSNAIRKQRRAQTIRARAGYKTTLATVTAIEYTGVIFCPTVSTGAFVARRNGKVFITGNSGFPKSLDIGKAIDKAAGAEREAIAPKVSINHRERGDSNLSEQQSKRVVGYSQTIEDIAMQTAPATDAAKQWDGWGSALKPAIELWTLCRKPLAEKTIAENVLTWGTGGLNIDRCRVPVSKDENSPLVNRNNSTKDGYEFSTEKQDYSRCHFQEGVKVRNFKESLQNAVDKGRFPANLITDGSDEVTAGFPQTAASGENVRNNTAKAGKTFKYSNDFQTAGYADSGSAARFFYCAKASKSERNAGLGGFEERQTFGDKGETYQGLSDSKHPNKNHHPTVKPLALMRYLCRLITPPNGIVLDPFTGSGSTGCGAIWEGFNFIGIERESDYAAIAQARITHAQKEKAADAASAQQNLF